MLDPSAQAEYRPCRPIQPFVAFRKYRLRIRNSRSNVRSLFAMFAQKYHKETQTMSATRHHIADNRKPAQPMRDAGPFARCAYKGRDTID